MSLLPAVGDLYWVESWVFGGSDPKDARPVVVVRAPSDLLDRVVVITRTTDTKARGVAHPADPVIECGKPGVFSLKFHRSVEATLFVEPQARRVGALPEPYLSQVLSMWENG